MATSPGSMPSCAWSRRCWASQRPCWSACCRSSFRSTGLRDASVRPAQLAIKLGQYPRRADQQISEIGEEAGTLALVQLAVANELADPGDDEYADAQR